MIFLESDDRFPYSIVRQGKRNPCGMPIFPLFFIVVAVVRVGRVSRAILGVG